MPNAIAPNLGEPRKLAFPFTLLRVLGLLLLALAAPAVRLLAADLPPPLIPWPQQIKFAPGKMELGSQTHIIARSEELRPLAEVLAGEISLATGLRLPTKTGAASPGDIVLSLEASLKDEAHTFTVTDRATVQGGNYGPVALGTVTLLQSLQLQDGKVYLPRLAIEDAPKTTFRGLMVDVARQFHSIANLQQMVELCRLYKIRYLQLHLTDDPSFMFPSKTFPQLATKNQHGGKTYTLEELKGLVAFADARNVTIIPEYEVPGHSAAANRAMRDLFMIKGTKPYEHHASINFAKPEVMQAVDTIVGEMCEVFRSSPYFHIGGDEADLAFAHQNEEFQAAFKKFNLPNQHQLYRKFVADMNEIVKKHGKQMIVWEGFGREPKLPVQIPKDVIVMEYEIRFYMPDRLVQDGYKVINASWTPLYVVNRGRPTEEIYAWQLRQFKPYGAKPADRGVIVPPDAPVFGAQMCAWEQSEVVELPSTRRRLPAMSERVWNPSANRTYADFAGRLESTDRLLDSLVHRFSVRAEGTLSPGDHRFDREVALTVSLSPAVSGTIRYTLNGKEPATNSPVFTGPIRLTTTTAFKARLFDPEGQPLGYPWWTRFELHPIHAETEGLLSDDRFGEALTLTLRSTAKGEIRYTLDGKDPSANAPLYAAPLRLDTTAKVKAALFAGGKRLGEVWSGQYTKLK